MAYNAIVNREYQAFVVCNGETTFRAQSVCTPFPGVCRPRRPSAHFFKIRFNQSRLVHCFIVFVDAIQEAALRSRGIVRFEEWTPNPDLYLPGPLGHPLDVCFWLLPSLSSMAWISDIFPVEASFEKLVAFTG